MLTLLIAGFALGLAMYFVLARYDLYRPEPIPARVVAVFVGGAAFTGAFLLGRAWILASNAEQPGLHSVVRAAAITAGAEELAKFGAVIVVALCFRKSFRNDPFDGVVYGALVGVGAGLAEFVAAVLGGMPAHDASVQLLTSSLGHPVLAGIGAGGLGLLRVRSPRWSSAKLVGACLFTLFIALSLHFAWNILAMGIGDGVIDSDRGRFLQALVMTLGLAGFVGVCGAALIVTRLYVDPSCRPRDLPDRPWKLAVRLLEPWVQRRLGAGGPWTGRPDQPGST